MCEYPPVEHELQADLEWGRGRISANLRHPGKTFASESSEEPLSRLRGSQMKRNLAAQIKCSAVNRTQIPLSASFTIALFFLSLQT